MNPRRWLPTLTCLLLGLSACEQALTTGDAQCSSGERWTGGNQGSALMHPGRDCIACHSGGGGPRYGAVGTVYDALDEKNDCFGVADVQVELTGADGAVVRMTTNDAGTFVLGRGKVTTPYTAKLIYEGRERPMAAAQTNLDCASCHTATGANNAPGRILAP